MSRSFAVPVAACAACAALVAVVAVPSPALAGIHYEAETRTDVPGQAQRTAVEAWVDGPKAKIAFTETATPGLRAGQYLLTQDGGKTLLLVDPKEKTYAEWNLEAMLQMFGSVLQAMGPVLDVTIDGVEVETLEKGSGGELLGYPVTRAKYRTTYTTTLKILGMKRQSTTETVQEIWSTDALDDVALGVWLRGAAPTGFEELDELVAAEVGKLEGFPLKTVAVSTTTGQKGKRSQETRTTTEVTSLDGSADVPAPTFELPAGYTRSEALVPQAAEEGDEEEDGSPFRKLLGGG